MQRLFWIEALGLLAAACTTTAFFPQAYRVWRTRSTRDISLAAYAMLCLGLACWLAYGLLTASLPIILGNAVTLIPAAMITVMKLREERARCRTAPRARAPGGAG